MDEDIKLHFAMNVMKNNAIGETISPKAFLCIEL
jgi:hypothetical protein